MQHDSARSGQIALLVSILTRPGGRVQPITIGGLVAVPRFQSSPVPEDGCNYPPPSAPARRAWVSILTRPGGRVQLACIVAVPPLL